MIWKRGMWRFRSDTFATPLRSQLVFRGLLRSAEDENRRFFYPGDARRWKQPGNIIPRRPLFTRNARRWNIHETNGRRIPAPTSPPTLSLSLSLSRSLFLSFSLYLSFSRWSLLSTLCYTRSFSSSFVPSTDNLHATSSRRNKRDRSP